MYTDMGTLYVCRANFLKGMGKRSRNVLYVGKQDFIWCQTAEAGDPKLSI
jgi:hypothetical protein